MKLDLQFFASGVITADAVKSSSNTKLQAKLEWSSKTNELENTSTITTKLYGRRADTLSGATSHAKWSGKVKVGSIEHSFSSMSSSVSVSTSWVLFKTYTDVVEHEADGTKKITLTGSLTGPTGTTLAGITSSKSATVELDKIPRQSNLEEIPRFDIDMGFVFNAEKPVDTFYRKLDIKNGETILRTILEEDLENGLEYLLSDDINTIYEIMSSEIEHTFTFDLYTYEDSTMATQIGSVSTQSGVGYVTDCNPTFGGFDCVDSNAVTVALTGDNTVFIPNESNAQITIETPATAYKGASIVGYNIIGNQIEYVPANEYPLVHTINEVSSSFGIQAVDSRGLVSNTIYKNLTWVSGYVAPKVQNLRLIREGGVSENVLIAFSGTIWEGNFGQGNNKVTHIAYRVKQSDGTLSDWFDITDQVNITTPTFIINESNGIYIHENGISGGFSTGGSYTIELMLYDGIEATAFNSSYATANLDDGKVLDSYYKAGSGYRYAINGIVDPEGDILQVYDDNGKLMSIVNMVYPVGSIYISASATVDPNILFTGTKWERFANGRTLVGVDEADEDFVVAEQVGGHKELQEHSHTGTTNSDGAHMHATQGRVNAGSTTPSIFESLAGAGSTRTVNVPRSGTNGAHSHAFTTNPEGTGDSGNLQPYITVYMWKRIE